LFTKLPPIVLSILTSSLFLGVQETEDNTKSLNHKGCSLGGYLESFDFSYITGRKLGYGSLSFLENRHDI
jgi:hypothetical protein